MFAVCVAMVAGELVQSPCAVSTEVGHSFMTPKYGPSMATPLLSLMFNYDYSSHGSKYRSTLNKCKSENQYESNNLLGESKGIKRELTGVNRSQSDVKGN